MKRPSLILCFPLVFLACGGDDVPVVGYGDLDGVGGAGGSGGAGEGASSTSTTSSTSAASSSASSTSTATSSTSSGQGGGPACDYSAPGDCIAAEEIASIDGDSNNDMRNVSGTTEYWYRIYVAEASVLSTDLSFSATLTSPPGINWDLYVYQGDSTAPKCFADPDKALGDPDTATFSWSDTFGSEDGRWYNLEVRYAGGSACGVDATWNLAVVGNP